MNPKYKCHHGEGCNCPADSAVKVIWPNWTAPELGYDKPGVVSVVNYYCSEHADLAVTATQMRHNELNDHEQEIKILRMPLQDHLNEISPRMRTRERA